MKWLLIAVAVLVVVGLLVALIGWRVPQAHAATGQARLRVPPEAVWRAVTDVDAFPQWREGVRKVERLPDRDGRPVWIEQSRSGSITLATERSEPPRLLVLRIADTDAPFGGTWTYTIESTSGGSLLTITENGEIYNPVFRFMARYVFGYEATLKSYLSSIERHLAAGAPASTS